MGKGFPICPLMLYELAWDNIVLVRKSRKESKDLEESRTLLQEVLKKSSRVLGKCEEV